MRAAERLFRPAKEKLPEIPFLPVPPNAQKKHADFCRVLMQAIYDHLVRDGDQLRDLKGYAMPKRHYGGDTCSGENDVKKHSTV